MTDKAIIQGSLVDVRNVNQHKCVRMLIDVPAELAPKVMEAFGWPTMANPVPVAIAHLAADATQKADKPRRSWDQLSRAEQAGIASNDVAFSTFLTMQYERDFSEYERLADGVADAIRWVCAVSSRSELDRNERAAKAWDKLYSDYQMWQRGAAA